MKQDELERRILDSARDYNAPPEPPREEMWAAIREGLQAGRAAAERSDRTRILRLRRWSPWIVGLAAAATLAVGFGLGRLTGPGGPVPGESGRLAAVAAPATAPSRAVQMAAADHLGEAEAMLTLFRTSDRSEDRAATAAWARDLLVTTRIMMDSRLGRDPEMSALLGDLELVLVQIVGAVDPSEQELIEEGIEERQLLTKLRSVAASPDAAL